MLKRRLEHKEGDLEGEWANGAVKKKSRVDQQEVAFPEVSICTGIRAGERFL